MTKLYNYINSLYLESYLIDDDTIIHFECKINSWLGETYPMIAVNHRYVRIVEEDLMINIQIDEELIKELEIYYPEALI